MARYFKSYPKISEVESLIKSKKEADESWGKVFQNAFEGNIDRAAIVGAMTACNVADLKCFRAGLFNEKLKK